MNWGKEEMEELHTDILMIGGGLAGILSALEIERTGLHVSVVGKFAIGMGTNTSLSNGHFAAEGSYFSKEDHLRTTLASGKGLNQRKLVETLVEKGPDAIEKLRAYGVPMVDGGVRYEVNRPKGSWQIAGVLLMRALVDRFKGSSIQLLPGLHIFDLIVEEGEVRGAFGFFRDGKPCLIHSKAVILAAGGAGAIYRRNDNQKTILGDGYAMALRAGLPLFDLEFVQFFPFVLAEPKLSTFPIFSPHPRERRLINEKGEDLLEKLGIQDVRQATISQRDRLSLFLFEASQNGHAYFDMTHVPEEKWEDYPLNFLGKSKFPFRDRPFLILPAVHFFMGGMEIDGNGKTALPGLFAAGEVTWGIHGANRLGGNALTECVVFGSMAAKSAAEYVRLREFRQIRSNSNAELFRRKWGGKVRNEIKGKTNCVNPRALLKDLKDLAWKYVGPVREEETLKEGLVQLGSLEQRMESIQLDTPRDLIARKDVENVILLLKALLQGSLARRESRGSFFRKDFPNQDDQEWLKNTCYQLGNGEFRITHRPVCSWDIPPRSR